MPLLPKNYWICALLLSIIHLIENLFKNKPTILQIITIFAIILILELKRYK